LAFLVTDGILIPLFGWSGKVVVDDGSSSQNGQMAYWQNKEGTYNLPADSPWRADLAKYMAIITYQQDTSQINAPSIVNPYAANAREINDTDKQYAGAGVGN